MQRKITVIICSTTLVVALVSLWLRLKPATQVDRAETIRINTAFGAVLAEETIKAVNGQGRVVVVTAHDPAQLRRWTDNRWDAFVRELKKHPAIRLTTAVANFEPEPGRAFMPGQPFLDILERHPDAAAFVFLVDLPEWPAVSHALPEHRRFKLIATDDLQQPTQFRYGGYFNNGILVAILAPAHQPGTSSPPQTQRDWFHKFYQVYTPQNFASQPD